MIDRLLATSALLVPLVLLPVLEIRDTHVFNTVWPPHARLHEVWQLSTNVGIALVALWLVWKRGEVRIASVLGLCMVGGALVAHVLAPAYGGALSYPGAPGGLILGIQAAMLVPLVSCATFAAAVLLARRPKRAELN